MNTNLVMTLVAWTILTLSLGSTYGEGESQLDTAKRRFSYAQWESKRTKHDMVVTNWQPEFRQCGGTNFVTISATSTNSCRFTKYAVEIHGGGRVYVDVYEVGTQEAAHEMMLKAFTRGNDQALQEVAETSKRIGDRCFLVRDSERTVGVYFIRNNIYVGVAAVQKGVDVEKFGRALDKQIQESSSNPQ